MASLPNVGFGRPASVRPPGGHPLLAVVAIAAGLVLGAAVLRFARVAAAAPPRAYLPGLAVVSAMLAAQAEASPTGLRTADVVARAILGAGMVLAASRAPLGTCAAAGVLAVACSAGSSVSAVAAGAAFGVVVAVLATGERGAAPTLMALAGMGLAQSALRLAWPDPTGASAAAAALIMAPVLMAGLRRAPVEVRRVVARVTGAFLLFSLVASVLAVLAAVGARTDVDKGVRAAREGLAAVEQADRDGAASNFDTAAISFDTADGSVGAWWARPALVVPIVGQHSRALRTLAGAGADLAAVGARTAREADPDTIRLSNGGFDLEALAAARRPVEAAMASLDRSRRALDEVRSPWLLDLVAERVDELSSRVTSASTSTRTAVLALRNAPGLLGANGARRYFLAVQTPAESRASGGLMGNFGELVAEDGRISLGRFGRVDDLNTGGAGTARTLSGPPDYVRRYAPYSPAKYWQTVTMSPDFPSVARVMAELYPQSGGTTVDGVISVDPFAFAALLKLVGPIQVEGRSEPITAENAPRVLLHDQYVQFGEHERVDFLDAATRSLFARLTSITLPAPRIMADALSPVVAGRHLQLASVRPAEQRFFEHIGAAGAVPPLEGDFLGVVTQNFNGNKIDWFLRRSYSYDANYDPGSGAMSARLEVRLRNEAPAEGLPRSVIGYGGALVPSQPATQFGENLLLLSVYSPLGLDRMTVEGQAVTASQQNELGRRVYSALVSVPARSTRTVRLELSGRVGGGDRYRLDVLRQPTVAADRADISLSFGDRWRVRSTSGLRTGSPDMATAGGITVDRSLTLLAAVERPTGGLIDRIRHGR